MVAHEMRSPMILASAFAIKNHKAPVYLASHGTHLSSENEIINLEQKSLARGILASPIADYMIVVSGNTVRQVTAMANNLIKKYKEMGLRLSSPEGMSNGDWVLIDANDILIHIFRPEVRDFYSLEKMWEKKHYNISSDAIKK